MNTIEINSSVLPRVGEQFFIDDELADNHCGGMKNFLVIKVYHSLDYRHRHVTTTVTVIPVSSIEENVPEQRVELLQKFGWLNEA